MNEIINSADSLASKSPWVWVLASFIGWIVATFFMIRYMTIKRDETIDKLVAAEREKAELLMKVQMDQKAIYHEHAQKFEALVERTITVQHEIARGLEALKDAVRK